MAPHTHLDHMTRMLQARAVLHLHNIALYPAILVIVVPEFHEPLIVIIRHRRLVLCILLALVTGRGTVHRLEGEHATERIHDGFLRHAVEDWGYDRETGADDAESGLDGGPDHDVVVMVWFSNVSEDLM